MEIEIESSFCQNVSNDKYIVKEDSIPTIENESVTYADFYKTYLASNKPCIVKNVAKNWDCTKYWIGNNCPNFDYLKQKYGTCPVTIYDCEKKYYNSQFTENSSFSSYITYWIEYKNNKKGNLYYLKDWHLKNQFPEDNFYEVPLYFTSDWLNEYFIENLKDDYRFVYMGPKGTWTPFHVDVFTSYSWSVNICGQKRWLLFPPGEESHLKDSLQNLPYDVLTSLSNSVCRYFDVIQNPGEAIFVPSCWHHQVWNLKDTISVNHNWVNGCNINNMWVSIEENLTAVKKEIEDCKSMDNYLKHCRVMLEASFGLNFFQFYQFIKHIAMKRIKLIERNVSVNLFNNRILGKNHALFDLRCVEMVLNLFLQHDDVNELEEIKNDNLEPINLLHNIRNCLKNNV